MKNETLQPIQAEDTLRRTTPGRRTDDMPVAKETEASSHTKGKRQMNAVPENPLIPMGAVTGRPDRKQIRAFLNAFREAGYANRNEERMKAAGRMK